MQPSPLIIVFITTLFPVVFVLFWIGVIYLISWLSGWQRLAKKYATWMEPPTLRRSMASARIGLSNYNGVLQLGLNPQGIYLSVFILFRVGHKPLFIPWSEIDEVTEVHFLFRKLYKIKIRKPELTTILLPKHYFEGWEQYLLKK